ncbi:MAG: glycosyltransferase family 2 protein [Acidimicrobiia bacterium]|jgi:glycosyltransferase involved in cell wall biosynthesis
MLVSIVVPVLNEAQSLPLLLRQIDEVMAELSYDFEVVVVDDGSTDGSADEASRLGARVLRSPRNAGKSAALQAGFDATPAADVVITMDGDLQDDPAEIPRMIDALRSFDMVNGWKADRKDSWSRRFQSRVFGWAVRRLSGVDLHDFNSGFKAYRRSVLDALRLTGDQHRLIPVLAVEAGFTVTEIPVNHRHRKHGTSRFGAGRVFRGPMDLITVLFIARFGRRPLHILGGAGLLVGLVGLVIAGYLTWIKFVNGAAIGDRPLLLLSILMMMAGLQLFAVGLLGEMILVSTQARRESPFRPLAAGQVDFGSGPTENRAEREISHRRPGS